MSYTLTPERFEQLARTIMAAEYCPVEHICAQHVSDALITIAANRDNGWADDAWDHMTYQEMCSAASDVRDWIHEARTSAAEAQTDYVNSL